MELSQINNTTPTKHTPLDDAGLREALVDLDPSSIIDSSYCARSVPFIYISRINETLIGTPNNYHDSIIETDYDNDIIHAIRDVYGRRAPGLVGRVGYDLQKLPRDKWQTQSVKCIYQDIQIVSFYAWETAATGHIGTCIKELQKQKLITPAAYVIFGKQVRTVNEITGGGGGSSGGGDTNNITAIQAASKEEQRRARLQIALHLGTAANGRRLTQAEKNNIRKELGLDNIQIRDKNKWQKAGEKAGYVLPGHKWWAPTSESKQHVSSFDVKLNEALRHKWVDPAIPSGEKYTGFRFSPVNVKSVNCAKVWEVISDKIARVTGYDFIFLVGDKFAIGSDHPHAELSAATGIPVDDFKDAITIIIGYDTEQDVLTPWMIIHQVGEIMDEGELWPTIYKKYASELDAAPPPSRLRRRNPYLEKYENAYVQLFRMRSARNFDTGPAHSLDTGSELMAEYLWHGKIRVNYPSWLDRKTVDAIKNDVERALVAHLDRMVGKAFNNLKYKA